MTMKTFGTFTVKIAIVAAAALGGTALISSSVFASLTASAENGTATSVTAGTLFLAQSSSGASGGFTTAINGIAPNDVVNRYVMDKNTGTLNASGMTLSTSAAVSNILTNEATKGLKVNIFQCSVAYSVTWTCASETEVLAIRFVSTTISPAAPVALTLLPASLNSNGESHLRIAISLPDTNETSLNGVVTGSTVQGVNAAITWTFTTTQRIGTTTNS